MPPETISRYHATCRDESTSASPEAQYLPRGHRVGRYRILRLLGTGGMGQVYLASAGDHQATVAIKVMGPGVCSDREWRARFQREAEALAAVRHPHVVRFLDIGLAQGCLYIAMELLEGSTLDLVLKAGALPIARAITVALDVALGLSAAHEAGIVHRDVKPSNIMIDASGQAKLFDFGLARSGRDLSTTGGGRTIGTPQYESPEQLSGATVDPRSDLFSLGAVLYEMVAGALPFAADHVDAIPYAILHEPPTPLETYTPSAPAGLVRIIDRLLEKDPKSRYPTGRRLARDLENVLASG